MMTNKTYTHFSIVSEWEKPVSKIFEGTKCLHSYFIGTEEEVIKRVEEINKEENTTKWFYEVTEEVIDTRDSFGVR